MKGHRPGLRPFPCQIREQAARCTETMESTGQGSYPWILSTRWRQPRTWPLPFDLEQALIERKFGALWHLDVNEKLKEKGFDLEPEFHFFEVCSAPRAKQAIETNIKVGYFLPCKVVVYLQGGHTRIGLLNPTVLIELQNDARLRDRGRSQPETGHRRGPGGGWRSRRSGL